MDFGLVGTTTTTTIDGFQLQQQQHHHHILEGKPKYNNNNNNENGSGQMKQERSDPFDKEEEDDRASKMAKHVVDFGLRSDTENNNNINTININNNNNINNNKQQMLSFSSSNDDIKPQVVSFLSANNNNNNDKNGFSFAPYYTSSSTSPGFGCGNMNGGMHGSFTGIRGPFTPAQWIELEHQAMIYKYLTANVPVPSNLLIPIRKAIQSAGFPGFSIASYPSLSYGWGSFHLGFTGNTDPEPGRCRRTDGKKWRCSRDAVPDQKYCERHINRGRHRSRKPVEGHTGQAASGAATPTTAKVVPVMPSAMSSLVSSGGGGGGGVPNGIATAQHHVKGLQPTAGAINASTDLNTKRLNDQQGLSVMSTTMNLESKDSRYSIPKQHISYEESLISDFGVVSNDSFLNPTQKSSYLDMKSYNSLSEFNISQTQDQYPLRHFMDNDMPKEHSHHSHKDPPNPDWTQLSMSIPISTDFSSSSPSPIQDKVGVGSRVGPVMAEGGGTKENGWTQIAWGSSMGGPLGEVLLNNNASNVVDKDERWDGSSPTGVLQRSTFVPYSNSSSVGSPRADQMMTRDDLLGSAARTTSSSIPSV